MKYTSGLLLMLAFTPIYAGAQGLKYEPEKTERFLDAKDSKVGLTTKDAAQNITWTRCAVNQEFDTQDSKRCKGAPAVMTYQAAVRFAKKLGNGWRLPTLWEVESASDRVRWMLSQGVLDVPGKYGGGGWACGGLGIWTTTGVDGRPNFVNISTCQIFSNGSNLKRNISDSFGSAEASVIVVRSN